MEYKLIMILLFTVAVLACPLSQCAAAGAHPAGKVMVHYHRPDADYDGWKLWVWNLSDSGPGRDIAPSGRDNFGLVFEIDPASFGAAGDIGILPKYQDWASKDDPNRVLSREALRASGKASAYMVSGSRVLSFSPPDISPFIRHAFLDSTDEVVAVFSKKLPAAELASLEVRVTDAVSGKDLHCIKTEAIFGGGDTAATRIARVWLGDFVKISDMEPFPELVVSAQGFRPARTEPRGVLYMEKFRYDGELGCIKTGDGYRFRVFAPAASSVEVALYDGASGPSVRRITMSRIGCGIWEAFSTEALEGKYYKYSVTTRGETCEAIDPYSRCNTAHDGRSLIVFDRTPVADSPKFGIHDAVIYEMHIRDFTIDTASTVVRRGKFLGAAEEGTRLASDPSVRTGMDHLRELGVNTVQILPIQDFENDETSEAYNWGYMPVHFNSPDGWYATATAGPERIAEVKRMIDAFHRNGIKVVMDVVYNHTAEGNELVRHGFNGVAPNYYYRRRADGAYWNGSGCGNEFKSESRMGRKFIVDSLKYWVREYKVDGFRFDLMGLIDLETMKEIVSELQKIKPDIFIYGEPWAAGGTPITVTGKGAQRGLEFGVFNDIFRDAIKGSVWDTRGAFVQGTTGAEIVVRGMAGSIDDFAAAPNETINYCEAHDNRTLYDTLLVTTADDLTVTAEKIKRMHKLATFLVLTAQGVPFLHAGQEMMRTKHGEENSYNKPDRINMIDWSRKVEHADVFEFVRTLIEMRRTHPVFRLRSAAEIRRAIRFSVAGPRSKMPEKCFTMHISAKDAGVDDAWSQVLVIVNANRSAVRIPIPAGRWQKFIFDFARAEGPIDAGKGHGHSIELPAISAGVLFIGAHR